MQNMLWSLHLLISRIRKLKRMVRFGSLKQNIKPKLDMYNQTQERRGVGGEQSEKKKEIVSRKEKMKKPIVSFIRKILQNEKPIVSFIRKILQNQKPIVSFIRKNTPK
uniref:Uncharacterized protein n=1 Tax=Cacopsylla melanoneura TaxID=428564 RepID=A0A8D9BZ08_9HEMI